MKARTRIGLLLFTISAASLAGLAIRNGIAQQEVKADGEYAFKLDFGNADWSDAGAKTMVYVFDSTSDAKDWIDVNVNLTPVGTVADVAIPNTYDTFIVVRFNPSTISDVADPWDAKWGQTSNIAIDASKDYVTVLKRGDAFAYDYDKLVDVTTAEGNRFYVDATGVSTWEDQDGDTYICFIKGEQHDIKTLSPVYPNAGFFLYYFEFDSDFSATKFIVIRGKDFDDSHWNNKIHQTEDIAFTASNKGNRAIKMTTSTDYQFIAKTDAFLANAWGTYFLGLNLCYDEGGMQTGWVNRFVQAPKFIHQRLREGKVGVAKYLDNENYFRTISNEGSDPMNRAVLRYDTIWVKNAAALSKETEYLGRNPSLASLPQGALVTIEKQDVAFPVGIACVSLLGIAGLGGLLLLKKKEQ